MYYDIGAYDMKNDEFKEMCHRAWSEKLNYLCIDMTKEKNDGKYRILNESKNKYFECFPEIELFKKYMALIHTSTPICVTMKV